MLIMELYRITRQTDEETLISLAYLPLVVGAVGGEAPWLYVSLCLSSSTRRLLK